MSRRSPLVLFVLALGHVAVAAAEVASRGVVFVANGEGGTVTVIDAGTFQVLRSIDVIPDGDRPSLERDPVQALAFPAVVFAGGDNFAQDLDLSPDGRTLYVSRGHLADVAAFDLASGTMLWRAEVGGFRADHMTISADGARLFVSAITENRVEVIDAATGSPLGSFETGEWPHDNVLSPDGKRVYNGSIGNVLLPEEARNGRPEALDAVLPPPYQLTIADAATLEIVGTHRFERGIRPFVLAPDEKRLYAQLSFFHGIAEYDLEEGRVSRTVELPVDEGVTSDDYDFEAPHHGLALSADGKLLCAAGRASDYVALVSTETFAPVALIEVADAPGWAVNGPDGGDCWVASTRADRVSVISYTERAVVAQIAVAGGPKYLLAAEVPQAVMGGP